ncbi:MAG: glycosyltransferase, partial [Thaumarchaeota archaeon]|nr:glycosyltransferase [Nitrososphaerota archaeon]
DTVKAFNMKQQIEHFAYKPKISIVLPVFNTDSIWLSAAIESVINQIYQNWELCIVDDGSTKPEVKETLSKYVSDNRIKTKYLAKNLGIAGASNEAISICTGEFVGFLDHDDELYSNALFEVVKRLNKQSDLDIIYSDEDKIENGRRLEPYFKPDWSPDLLLSQNFMAHFIVYRKKLLEEVGGFRSGFDGTQDYDLALRSIEKTEKIDHIRKVLYGWRKISTSTALSQSAKSYASSLSVKALQDSLKRQKIDGTVVIDKNTKYFRVIYKIKNDPLVSIVIITHDKPEMLKNLLESIEKNSSYTNYEIIVIDRKSEQRKTLKFLKKLKHKVIRFDDDHNYSKEINYAMKFVKGSHIIIMNDDMQVVNAEWLEAMLEHSQRSKIGAVGNLLIYPPSKHNGIEIIQHGGVILNSHGVADHAFNGKKVQDDNYFNLHRIVRNCIAVTGGCIMFRKDVFEEVGEWDENLPMVFQDVDFCLRVIKKGFRIVYTPYSKVYHFEGATRGKSHPKNEEDYFINKWEDVLLNGDPYYNCNLSLISEPYSISVAAQQKPPLSALLEFYYLREDLQKAFPEASSGNYDQLVKWAKEYGVFEYPQIWPYVSWYRRYTENSATKNTKLNNLPSHIVDHIL